MPSNIAVVIGSTGGIGAALLRTLQDGRDFDAVIGLSRTSSPALDLRDEASIAAAAGHVAGLGALRLVILCTGRLHGPGMQPEKNLRSLDAAAMADAFIVNTSCPCSPAMAGPCSQPSRHASAASATTGWAAGTAIAPPRPR
jgi:NAD(P)-dependent dehydrogenase (short-subunit alcohol dehydrogenase family)